MVEIQKKIMISPYNELIAKTLENFGYNVEEKESKIKY